MKIPTPCPPAREGESSNLDSKNKNRDVSATLNMTNTKDLESKIDILVYKLYDLNENEIKIIES